MSIKSSDTFSISGIRISSLHTNSHGTFLDPSPSEWCDAALEVTHNGEISTVLLPTEQLKSLRAWIDRVLPLAEELDRKRKDRQFEARFSGRTPGEGN